MKRISRRVFLACAGLIVAACGSGGGGGGGSVSAPAAPTAASPSSYRQLSVIADPGLTSFDIGYVDPTTHRYYLANRSHASVDVANTQTDTFLAHLQVKFVGAQKTPDTSGPAGVLLADGLIWAGDGNSTVKAIDPKTQAMVANISTGGSSRVDEMAFDARDHVLAVANDADTPPFLTFISTATRTVLGKLSFPDADNGYEQTVWSPSSGKLYSAIPSTTTHKGGEIAVIDPSTQKLVTAYPLTNCMPTGLAIGPDDHAVIGCTMDSDTIKLNTQIIDLTSGNVTDTLDQVGGADEVWYNSGAKQYYVAAGNMTSDGTKKGTPKPSVGVIDAVTNRWLANLPTSAGAHSVAADPSNNHIYVPSAAKGGIIVFGPG